jgi:transcriptional antiterminator NusG
MDNDEEAGWFVVHTYSGQESRVQQNLQNRIESMDVQDRVLRVVVPVENEVEIRGGEKKTVEKRIFPGYILVNMFMDQNTWRIVRDTPGVTGFVSAGDPPRPVPLKKSEVSTILQQMESQEPRIRIGFTKGQSVRITEGPFQDFIGVVDEINMERGKVKALVSFFGRETPVELDFLQVEKL